MIGTKTLLATTFFFDKKDHYKHFILFHSLKTPLSYFSNNQMSVSTAAIFLHSNYQMLSFMEWFYFYLS
jgi:hypothetical protein